MNDAVIVAVVLAVCFWPALALGGLGWWGMRVERKLSPERADGEAEGVPGWAVVAVVLGAVSAAVAGGVLMFLLGLG